MKLIKTTLTLFLLLVILMGTAYFYGGYKAKKEARKEREVITSQVIFDKIKDQYFLVTKTLLVSEKIEIEVQNSEGWKDFFTGDKLSAEGSVRLDVGVDLAYFSANDIVINHINKDVIVYLPGARILDASIKNDINVETQKGVWTGIKDFFAGDKNEDYNRAARELIAQAEIAVNKQTDVFFEAREAGSKLVELVINSYLSGYSLEIREK